MRLTALLLLFCLLAVAESDAKWQRSNGPLGGIYRQLAIDNEYLYTVADGFFWRMPLAAGQWEKRGGIHDAVHINAFGLLQHQGNFYFATKNRGLYQSLDDGLSWSPVDIGIDRPQWLGFAGDDERLVMWEENEARVSSDKGLSWQVLEDSPVTSNADDENVFAIDGAVFVVGSRRGLLWVSNDYGASWANASLTSDGSIGSIQNAVIDGSIILVSTSEGGLFRSVDTGDNWDNITTEGFLSTQFREILMLDDVVYAGGWRDGLLRRPPEADDWEGLDMRGVQGGWIEFMISSAEQQSIYVSINGSGIYEYKMRDRLWQPRNAGLPQQAYPDALYFADDRLYTLVSLANVQYSDDGGDTWQLANAGLPFGMDINAINGLGNTVLIGTRSNGILRSSDGGQLWRQANAGIDTSVAVGAITRVGNRIVSALENGEIYASDDTARTWQRTGSPDAMIGHARSFLVHKNCQWALSPTAGLFRSEDAWQTWESYKHPDLTESPLAFCSTDDLLVVADISGLHLSRDKGLTWTTKTTIAEQYENTQTPIGALLCTDDVIICNLNAQGYYKSTDEGDSWQPVNEGLDAPANYRSRSMLLHKGMLYSASEGLWRRPLADVVGVADSQNDRMPLFVKLQPNPAHSQVRLNYHLIQSGSPRVEIVDLHGRLIGRIDAGRQPAGKVSLSIDLRDYPPGLCFIRLRVVNDTSQALPLLIR